MANYIGTDVSGFNSTDLWVPNTGVSTSERFEGLISSNTGFGTRTETYSRFSFESGGLTYEYEGQWTLTASTGVVTNTVAASGTYNSVTVRAPGGTVVAQATGLSLPVEFGTATTLTLLDVLNPIVGPVLTLLFGGGSAESFANLHTDATPNIDELAFQGADLLQGGGHADVLVGHAGNDTLNGGGGADRLEGGLGDDLYYVDDLNDVVVDAGGNDRVIITVAGYDLSSLSGVENVVLPGGSGGNDTMTGGDTNDDIGGGAGNDHASGGAGSDVISGGDGNDVLDGGTGGDNVSGGAGNDTLTGGEGNDYLDGGSGADNLTGGAGDDVYVVDDPGDLVIEGPNQGNDTVYSSINYGLTADVENLTLQSSATSGQGNDLANLIIGSLNGDTLNGLGGNDTIYGRDGNDQINGGADDDTLYGEAGNDGIRGSTGNDTIYGSAGKDRIVGDAGNDQIYGEADNDVVRGASGNDLIYGGTGKDQATGDAGNDRVYGEAGDDVARGGSGNDRVFGGSGNDRALGDAGNDQIDGGTGNDLLYGGSGRDAFYFVDRLDARTNVDRVVDFNLADDVFRLENAVFTGIGGNGQLSVDAFTIGATATDAADRIIYDANAGALYFDRDGSGSAGQVKFATVTPSLQLTSNDFYII